MRNHPWFKDFDWNGLKAKRLSPPYVPDLNRIHSDGTMNMLDKTAAELLDPPPPLTEEEQSHFINYEYPVVKNKRTRTLSSLSKFALLSFTSRSKNSSRKQVKVLASSNNKKKVSWRTATLSEGTEVTLKPTAFNHLISDSRNVYISQGGTGQTKRGHCASEPTKLRANENDGDTDYLDEDGDDWRGTYVSSFTAAL
jgi:hypothetical protein